MRIEIGKTPSGSNCPRLLFSVHRNHDSYNFLRIGRLYVGYVGIMVSVRRFVTLDLWIYRICL